MTEINIEDQNPEKKIIKSEVKRIASLAANMVCRKKCFINIVFVTDKKIRCLNKKYLGKDIATDVLAFQGEDFAVGPAVTEEDGYFLGDIAISSDRAAFNAGVYGVSFRDEIARYVAHGILHLGGYEDTSSSEREKMRKKEDEILRAARKKNRK